MKLIPPATDAFLHCHHAGMPLKRMPVRENASIAVPCCLTNRRKCSELEQRGHFHIAYQIRHRENAVELKCRPSKSRAFLPECQSSSRVAAGKKGAGDEV